MSIWRPIMEGKKPRLKRGSKKGRVCQWCASTTCEHCRCAGMPTCKHKPGGQCPKPRAKNRYVCNSCRTGPFNKKMKEARAARKDPDCDPARAEVRPRPLSLWCR